MQKAQKTKRLLKFVFGLLVVAVFALALNGGVSPIQASSGQEMMSSHMMMENMDSDCIGEDCKTMSMDCALHCLFSATSISTIDALLPIVSTIVIAMVGILLAMAFPIVLHQNRPAYTFAYKDPHRLLSVMKRE